MKIKKRSVELAISISVQALSCLIGAIYGFILNKTQAPVSLLNDAYITQQGFFTTWLKNGGVAICIFLLGTFLFGFIAVYPIVYIKFFSLGYVLGMYAKNDTKSLLLIILLILPSVIAQFIAVSQLSYRAFVFSLNLSCTEEPKTREGAIEYFKNGIVYMGISTAAALYDYFVFPVLFAKCLDMFP